MDFNVVKKYLPIILISVITYILFFYKLLLPQYLIYSGKDSTTFHYQSRIYLYDQLQKGIFPYWTERMFLGFPIYADMERGYLNPVNILLVQYLGPFYSYKVLHLICYLVGSISLYIFLKNYQITKLGFAVSNLIYFFSFFFLYHQQHFSITLISYLFPLGLVIIDKFLYSNLLRYPLYNATLLGFCFYLGSFQFVFFFILLEFLYLVSLEKFSKKVLSFILFTFIPFVIIVLPGIFSALPIYLQSDRSTSLNFIQGSYTPAMIVNLVIPFIFNNGINYMGTFLSPDYLMHETYIYVGISSLISSVFSYFSIFILKKHTKLRTFLNYLIISFLILAFIKYVPLLNKLNIPPLSLFRYWGRSVIFINLAVSILVGLLISNADLINVKIPNIFNLKNINNLLKHHFIKVLSIPILYLSSLEILNILGINNKFDFSINAILNNSSLVSILKVLSRDDYIFSPWYILWGLVFLLSVIVITFKRFRKKEYIAILVILDLLLFGFMSTNNSMIKLKSDIIRIPVVPSILNSSLDYNRVLDLSDNISGDNNLLTSAYGVSGYSVFYSKGISNTFKNLGIKSLRHTTIADPIRCDLGSTLLYIELSDLGLDYVIDPYGNVIPLGDSAQTTVRDFSYIRDDGLLYFKVNLYEDTIINTYIKNYYGWEIYIDDIKNIPVEGDNDSIFIHINVPQGIHTIKMHFIPKDLYNGITVSVTLAIIFITFVYANVKWRKRWEF